MCFYTCLASDLGPVTTIAFFRPWHDRVDIVSGRVDLVSSEYLGLSYQCSTPLELKPQYALATYQESVAIRFCQLLLPGYISLTTKRSLGFAQEGVCFLDLDQDTSCSD